MRKIAIPEEDCEQEGHGNIDNGCGAKLGIALDRILTQNGSCPCPGNPAEDLENFLDAHNDMI